MTGIELVAIFKMADDTRMPINERTEWDHRYREGTHSSLTPDPFVVSAYEEFVAPAFPNGGSALDLAGGVGRHALFLAERGWQVTLLDISPVAVERATLEAGQRGLHINARQADLARTLLPVGYDLVVNVHYLERALFPQIADALKPGGFVIFKTYTRDQLKIAGGPTHPMHLLDSNELLRAFAALRVMYYRETERDRAVAELVARKE